MDAEAVCRESVGRLYASPTPDLEHFTSHLFSYSGEDQPTWALKPRGTNFVLRFSCLYTNSSPFFLGSLGNGFQGTCTITADLQKLSGALSMGIGAHGRQYWSLTFDVCIRFGGTELQAYLEWEENVSHFLFITYLGLILTFWQGVTCTGPATIIPENVVDI
jgi:hypothetical protein